MKKFIALFLILVLALPSYSDVVCVGSACSTPIGTVTETGSQTLTNKTLTSPLIGTSLLSTGTGTPIGTTTTPFSNIVLHLSGTYGTGSWTFAGTPTGNRVATLPGDASFTFAGLGLNQTFSGVNSFSDQTVIANNKFLSIGNPANAPAFIYSTTLTPDAMMLLGGSLSNSIHVQSVTTYSNDYGNGPCGTAVCTNPQMIVHDKDNNTTNYTAVSLSGLSGKFVVTLTESTPTAVVQIPVAAEASVSGVFIYTVHATDGSTPQTRSGRVLYNINNDGGTETCVLGTPEELDNTPTGTLTATIACSTSPTNAVSITIDAVSDLTQTTLEAYGTVIHVGAGEPLPQ